MRCELWLSESTIRSAYTILRAVLDTAVRDDALAKNPAAAVPRPKVSRKEAPHLTTAQVRALLEPPRILGWGLKPSTRRERARQALRRNAGRARRVAGRVRRRLRR